LYIHGITLELLLHGATSGAHLRGPADAPTTGTDDSDFSDSDEFVGQISNSSGRFDDDYSVSDADMYTE
jgi:hypothetical protein